MRRRFLIAALTLVAAFGIRLHAQAPVDPVQTLITASEQHFQAGQKELEQGHVDAAKLEFNRAVDVLLESTYGGRT